MSYDWHASFQVNSKTRADSLSRREDLYAQVRDPYAQIKLLGQIPMQPLVSSERWAKERAHYRKLVHAAQGATPYQVLVKSEQERLRRLGIYEPDLSIEALSLLPAGSFGLQFRVILEEPLCTKDDAAFYPHDNPVRKEWAFRLPMMPGSGWKGNFRAALRQVAEHQAEELTLLLGPERPQGSAPAGYFRAGRLHFFPTYWDKLDLEILNPHSRDTGGGLDPFNLEVVPAGSEGTFSLLYVPYDQAGLPLGLYREEIARHLELTAGGLQAMFQTLGFSAKRTSGFGLAQAELLSFHWGVHAFRERRLFAPSTPAEAKADQRPALEAMIDEFVTKNYLDAFPRWNDQELAASDWGKKRQSSYKRLRQEHPDWDEGERAWRGPGLQVEEGEQAQPDWEPLEEKAARLSFDDLVNTASRLAAALREEVLDE
ncbi:MAG: hypothetical protein JXA37_13070 [Chloroflexia bacterium]|nr:hypothetical protein [Chloroflexia bacterium]